MDMFEKINRSFGSWYEGLFGGSEDVRPKDILRRIFAAMEDHRKEGFDNRIYVPNQYILEIAVNDEEEKEYLLSFLDRDELEAAIRRYCQQNHYHIRGALDFTIKEVEDLEGAAGGKRGEKVRVRCRYNTKITAPESASRPGAALPEAREDERTVASVFAQAESGEESGTVPSIASATLVVYAPDRPPFRYTIARGAINIGRSAKAGNDLVIDSDGQISKRHARIELDPDGRFTLYDLGSTNGSKVNGRRVDNRTLNDGDEITLGATRITFQQSRSEAAQEAADSLKSHYATTSVSASAAALGRSQGAFGGAAAQSRAEIGSISDTPPSRVLRSQVARLVLTEDGDDVDDFLLASETVIGRGVTNDIVLPDRSIATRHARIVRDGDGYALETFGDSVTRLNGVPLEPGQPTPLQEGDRIGLGNLTLRFEAGA
jgi:pSer/pThr/pTyr-binding forkhead associated (FHA) protein